MSSTAHSSDNSAFMQQAMKSVRTVQWAMLLCIVLYAAMSVVIRPSARGLDPTISYVFTMLGVAIVGAIFVVRRTLVFRAAATLSKQPGDALSLSHWKTGYIMTYALCEMLALFGFVERFLGANIPQSVPYYIGGFVLMLFFRPQMPEAAASS